MTKKVVSLEDRKNRRFQKEWIELHDEAIDFVTELRGLIFGSGLLARPREKPMPMVAVMGLIMMQVEIMTNGMQGRDGSKMTPPEVNELLHEMVNAVVPPTTEFDP